MMMLVVILQEFHIHLVHRHGTNIQCTLSLSLSLTHTHTYGMFTVIPMQTHSLTLACRHIRECSPLTLPCRTIKDSSPSDPSTQISIFDVHVWKDTLKSIFRVHLGYDDDPRGADPPGAGRRA